ncbi:MAG TPA: hypothetical protein VFI41_04640 [Gemmatimonadales bacterium]|nr:hypothetical protein [Gemmatimonadales bacterium]
MAPRLLFVFENTVATLPSKAAEAREKAALKLRRWTTAVNQWEIPERAYALLWDVSWRYNYRFDIVTYRPACFGKALKLRLDDEGLPVGNVWASSPIMLAKKLAFMPDVRYVYDADPQRIFTYGGRGVHMPGGLAAFTSLW